jgi:DNA-binding transcriptional MocR family regulator
VKAIQDLGTSAVSQVFAERLLRADDVEQFVERRNHDLRERYAVLAARLRAELPSWRWAEPAGGLSVWVQLPAPVAEPFAQVALRAGVAVATAEALSPSTLHGDRLRLSFSSPGDVLVEGVRRLAKGWRAYTSSSTY